MKLIKEFLKLGMVSGSMFIVSMLSIFLVVDYYKLMSAWQYTLVFMIPFLLFRLFLYNILNFEPGKLKLSEVFK